MYEDAVDLIEQEDADCEALSVVQEAKRLQTMTLLCFDAVTGTAEMGQETPGQLKAHDEDEDIHDDELINIGLCVAQVQDAAWSVAEEARRLQFETARYETQLQGGTGQDIDETESTPQERAGEGSHHDVLQEALAVAREAERLQHLVVRLLAGVIEPAVGGETDND